MNITDIHKVDAGHLFRLIFDFCEIILVIDSVCLHIGEIIYFKLNFTVLYLSNTIKF